MFQVADPVIPAPSSSADPTWPHHHWHHDALAPVANNVPWYYIVLAIVIGAALLVHGVRLAFGRWEKELGMRTWFDVAGEMFGIVLATVMGGIAGKLIWNWALGAMVACVGAWSSSFVVSLIRAKYGAKDADDKK